MDPRQLEKIFESIEGIKDIIEARVQPPYSSENLNELFTALAKAQGDYPIIGSNRENPYFKSNYTDLDAILRAIRPALTKYGLSFTQQIRITHDGATILHTILGHASGQWMESRNRIIPAKNDAQTYGSTLTYQKRYAAMALLGVTCSHDRQDDDAEVAMSSARDIVAKGPSIKYNPKEQSSEVVTKEQLEELEYELQEYPDLAEMILDKLQLQSLADMPKSKYQVSINRIREIKTLRNGTAGKSSS
jgi:hypothetical protein